jgi:hypothetical protein
LIRHTVAQMNNQSRTMPKQNIAQNGAAVVQTVIEKKGFKRAEAATYLGVTPVTIDRLAKRGLLRPSRALRHPIYIRDDLDRFLRETSESIAHE